MEGQQLPDHVPQNPLAPVVVGLIRALSMERAAHDSTKEVLHEAVSLLAEQDRTIDRVKANNLHLLTQYRAAVSGQTLAEARQEVGASIADHAPDQEAA